MLYIALEPPQGPRGGVFQFLDAIGMSLGRCGMISFKPEEAKVILFSAFQNIPTVIRLRRALKNTIFVHRIDGPIRLYNNWNDKRDYVVQNANKFIADGTIFQSEWSRRENYRLGLRPSPYEIVIPNAPDPTIFNTTNTNTFIKSRKTRLIAVSWSTNLKKGFETYRWLDEHLDFSKYKMTFVGNSPISFRNIQNIPPLKAIDLAKTLKAHDILIFASEFEACSNTLLEALHCGLPVIARDATSNPEVLRGGGELFSTPEQIPNIIELIIKDYESYQKNNSVYSMDKVAQRYGEFIKKIYSDTTAGNYKPKQFTLRSRVKIESALFRWKLNEKLNSKLSRVKRLYRKRTN